MRFKHVKGQAYSAEIHSVGYYAVCVSLNLIDIIAAVERKLNLFNRVNGFPVEIEGEILRSVFSKIRACLSGGLKYGVICSDVYVAVVCPCRYRDGHSYPIPLLTV
jgi:hypothetical protein